MAIDIRTPNINAPTESGRLEQIRSYLYQMSEQLNWALNTVESNVASVTNQALQTELKTAVKTQTPEEVQSNFNAIKQLIIKSADIVEAYSEAINKKFEGVYLAQSDFGTFYEQESTELAADVSGISTYFNSLQEIIPTLENAKNQFIETTAYIKTGHIDTKETGEKIFGIEIGQEDTLNDKKIFDKYARFTSDRLSFFDNNGDEVAYISDKKLVITNVKISNSLVFGVKEGYVLDNTDGLAFIWEYEHKERE